MKWWPCVYYQMVLVTLFGMHPSGRWLCWALPAWAPFDTPGILLGLVCLHWHLFQVRRLGAEAAWPEPSMAQLSLPPGPSLFLTSLEVRADLQTCLCGVPGGARGLCSSLVLLGCPEDKGEKGPWGIADAVCKMPGWSCWELFRFLFGETSVVSSFPVLKVKVALKSENWSSSLYCQDFGKTATLTHCCWECKIAQLSWKTDWQRYIWKLCKSE